jgi:hypothetical protein
MATRKYNIGRDGSRPQDVTEATGAAVSSGAIQVTVDMAQDLSKREIMRGLDTIKKRIQEGNWPPA